MRQPDNYFETNVIKFDGIGVTDDDSLLTVVPGSDFVRSDFADAWPLHITAGDDISLRLMARSEHGREPKSALEEYLYTIARGAQVKLHEPKISLNRNEPERYWESGGYKHPLVTLSLEGMALFTQLDDMAVTIKVGRMLLNPPTPEQLGQRINIAQLGPIA